MLSQGTGFSSVGAALAVGGGMPRMVPSCLLLLQPLVPSEP